MTSESLTPKQAADRWKIGDFTERHKAMLHSLVNAKEVCGPADLRGLVIGMTGPISALNGTHFFERKLVDLDLSMSKLSCSFGKATCSSINFDACRMDACPMQKARFSDCSFQETRFSCPQFTDAIFEQCAFRRSQIIGKGIMATDGGRFVSFIGCDFTGSIFSNVAFRATRFISCHFQDAIIKNSAFTGVKFESGSPEIEQFENCDLRETLADGLALGQNR